MKGSEAQESHSPAWAGLATCVTGVTTGPWLFVQLRGEAVTPEQVIDDDDVDLLCDRANINELFDAANNWVKEGLCHVRITSRRADKIQFMLISVDGRHRAVFDLWVQLWQFSHGKRMLQFKSCRPLLKELSGIARLPVVVEASVYLHHLASKRKGLSKQSARARLEGYHEQCSDDGHDTFAGMLRGIITSGETTPEALGVAEAGLAMLNLGSASLMQRCARAISKIRSALIGPPRCLRQVSIMGCDGVGKTTLIRALDLRLGKQAKPITGKHLYRKSLLFKLAVIFIRPLLFQSRERFDESLAPIVYIRAAIGLRIKALQHRARVCLIDRSIVDFLLLDRKTDHPRFSRFKWLSAVLGRRILNVHCIVDWDVVTQRKQEVTEAGYSGYNKKMFLHFSGQTPTDYLLFNNDGDVDGSADALERCLSQDR